MILSSKAKPHLLNYESHEISSLLPLNRTLQSEKENKSLLQIRVSVRLQCEECSVNQFGIVQPSILHSDRGLIEL